MAQAALPDDELADLLGVDEEPEPEDDPEPDEPEPEPEAEAAGVLVVEDSFEVDPPEAPFSEDGLAESLPLLAVVEPVLSEDFPLLRESFR